MQVERGELLAIIGNSGSGKSTFLNMLGGLDTPSAGKLFVDGKNLFTMTEKQLVEYKRDTVGFVWQNNARNLLPYLSALENVMTPMQFGAEKNKKEQALKLLDMVGMSHKKASRLNQLSGGEQQRIAIAIALANQPKLLLADEPTGSVDRKTADYILDVFSSERILKEQYSLEGATAINWQDEETQEEYAIIDRAGRIQIPKDMLTEAGIVDNKLRMEVKDGKIILEKV